MSPQQHPHMPGDCLCSLGSNCAGMQRYDRHCNVFCSSSQDKILNQSSKTLLVFTFRISGACKQECCCHKVVDKVGQWDALTDTFLYNLNLMYKFSFRGLNRSHTEWNNSKMLSRGANLQFYVSLLEKRTKKEN